MDTRVVSRWGLVFALVTLFAAGALAQPGWVKSHQKISETQGNFSGSRLSPYSMSSLGDLDRDGVNDLAVANMGQVYVLFLNSDGTVKSHHVITQSGSFGHSVASLGDLDGDGVTDLAVGAIHDNDGELEAGAVWILFLNTDGTVKSRQKISNTQGGLGRRLQENAWFGWAVAAIGDLDGDGNTELAVQAVNARRLFVLFLNANGTVKTHTERSGTAISLAALGDLDGDGVNDLARGNRWAGDGGAVYVEFLNANGTVKSRQTISNTQGNFTGGLDGSDNFGRSVSRLNDLDGDGVDELAVGAYRDNDGGDRRGAVWILFLNTDGTVKSHQKISDTAGGFTGTLDNGDLFGVSVASLGDLDGDGVDDLAVGARDDDDGGPSHGAVWVLFLDGIGDIYPDSYSLFRGILTGGGLSDLFRSYDSWMTVEPGITLNQAERSVQLIIEGTASTETPSELRFRVEAHADINNIGQWIDLWNYDTNSYEQVDFMIATLADSIVEVSITVDPGRFIQAGTKQMKARVSYKEAGIVLSFPWLISFDQTVWVIVP